MEGFARILKEDYGSQLDKRGNDHIDRILSAAQRMNGMIDVLLDLGRLSSMPLRREAVNLSQLAEYILDDLRAAEPQRAVTVSIEPDLVKYGDPAMLRRVMENLVGNAWKYSGKAGHTHIEVFGKPVPDGRIAICVRDNGAGFDMRLLSDLFSPFHRLHSASDFPGDGIGLATVKRIIQRHGGDVAAEGAPGKGASFWFTVAERASAER
jgi:signal transduction histidine kinase